MQLEMMLSATHAKWIRKECWIPFKNRHDPAAKDTFLPIGDISERDAGATRIFTSIFSEDFLPLKVSAHDHVPYQNLYPV